MVWTQSEYENFYCFGCQSKHNIIHLVSLLDKISIKESIERLGDGFEFSTSDEATYFYELLQSGKIKDLVPTMESQPIDELSNSLLHISEVCKNFLQSVEYNQVESDRIDNIWKIVDDGLLEYDIEVIENIAERIGGVVRKRKLQLFENEEKAKRSE